MADYPYDIEDDLILIPVRLFGKDGAVHNSAFILDTGSCGIIVDHDIAYDLNYSPRDGVGFSNVASAAGRESGYRLIVEGFEALGRRMNQVEVRCHDLREQGVEGLVGMAFLKRFNWCIYPEDQLLRIKT